MKRCLLRLQIRDQLLDPINCELVADSEKQFLEMLDLLSRGAHFSHIGTLEPDATSLVA